MLSLNNGVLRINLGWRLVYIQRTRFFWKPLGVLGSLRGGRFTGWFDWLGIYICSVRP